jgi:hypothetical protein
MDDLTKTDSYKSIMNVYDKLFEVTNMKGVTITVEDYSHKDCMAYTIKYEYCNLSFSDCVLINEEVEHFDETEIIGNIDRILATIDKLR